MSTTSTPPTDSKPRADLVAITEPDLPQLASFIASQSGRPSAEVESHLRWFLLENPARHTTDAPLGWGLRVGSSGEFVGCILYVPQLFRFRDQTLTILGSSSFYVREDYRGAGGMIFLQFSRLARRYPLFGNSANAEASALWKARGAELIPDSDHELFGVIHWSPVIEELAARKVTPGALSRLAGSVLAPAVHLGRPLKLDAIDAVDLSPLTSPGQVMTLPIHAPPERLTADRNLSYIRWRYYSGRDKSVELFAARSRVLGKDVLVTVNQRTRGHRGQIRALNVLDVYPEISVSEELSIVGALLARFRDRADTVVLRCQDTSRQTAFQAAGFTRREFDAPNGWFLDKNNTLPSRSWHIVPSDGDWLI